MPIRVDYSRTFTNSTSDTASALTARPNDGTGYWPDFSNTGYQHEPDYPGSLSDYTGGMTQSGWVPVQPGNDATISYKRFLGKSGIGYSSGGERLTFKGCLFEGTFPNDNLVQIYPTTWTRFEYCTFKPNQLSAPPGNNGTITSSVGTTGTPFSQSWQYIANMTAGAYVEFFRCDIWGNAGCQTTGGPNLAGAGKFLNCYIHDQADTTSPYGAPNGQEYHHDGIGPDSEGGSGYTVVEDCTIASRGNTNGIALQGLSSYHHIYLRRNYWSGFGYFLSIGATTPWNGTNITVQDNIMSAELQMVFGPFYNVGNWNSGSSTNVWSGNRFQVRAGDQNGLYTTADHGKYWWPSDNSSHASDYAG